MALGSMAIAERDYINELGLDSASKLTAIAVCMIVSGLILVIWAVYGFFAAFLENKNALIVYYVGILLVFLLMCVVVLLGYLFRREVSNATFSILLIVFLMLWYQIADNLRGELYDSVPNYDPDRPDLPATRAWDRMQTDLQCCGVSPSTVSTADPPHRVWRTSKRLNSGGNGELRVPASCCLSAGEDGQRADCSSAQVADEQLIFSADCFDSATGFLQDHALTLCVLCAVFAFALIFAASLAISLYFLADD